MNPPLRRRLAWGALGALAVWAPVAAASPAPSYSELLAQAEGAPQRVQTAAELAAAKARRAQAAVWNNPELEISTEGAGAKRGGIDPSDRMVVVGQLVELGGKRAARIAAAQGDLDAAKARFVLSRNDFAARLAGAYAEAEAAQQRQEIAVDALSAAETDARAARLLFKEGKEAELRALQGAAEAEQAQAELAVTRGRATAAFARLAALAGSDAEWDQIKFSLLDSPAPRLAGPVGPTAADVARAEAAAAAARVRTARAGAVPDIKVTAGAKWFGETDSTGLVAGASVPLPLFNRNAGGVAAAQAELRAAEAKAHQAQLDLAADLRSAGAAAASAEAQLTAALSGEKVAAEAYRLARIGYQAGRVPLLELSAARRGDAEARARTVDAKLARVQAQAELARLSGQSPFGS